MSVHDGGAGRGVTSSLTSYPRCQTEVVAGTKVREIVVDGAAASFMDYGR